MTKPTVVVLTNLGEGHPGEIAQAVFICPRESGAKTAPAK
jgi:hypothetical protein